ncbi:SDR family oxidoreductase [Xylophilus sp. GW821-FHT01B05]
MTSLHHKTAIVTGASRGIGAAIAQTLAARGARVVVNYVRDAAAANAVVARIAAAGGSAVAVQADVGQAGAARQLFDAAAERFGSVDILVNNAGLMVEKLLADTSDEDFERLFALNVRGVFAGIREAATRLADGGRIVNFSSTLTRLQTPTYGAYSATKGAVEQLTRYAAKELGARRITVNAVLPGPTDTELFQHGGKPEAVVNMLASLTPLGRLGQVDDIARVVAFLVSDEAGWVTGQNIGVNGGLA